MSAFRRPCCIGFTPAFPPVCVMPKRSVEPPCRAFKNSYKSREPVRAVKATRGAQAARPRITGHPYLHEVVIATAVFIDAISFQRVHCYAQGMLQGDNHPDRAALKSAREETMEALSEAFTQDKLSLEELEQRMATAQECGSVAELRALVGDLGLLDVRTRVAAPLAGQTRPIAASAALTVLEPRERALALLGSVERQFVGPLERSLDVTALLGSVELDLCQAEFAPGVTDLDAMAYLGSIEILVPPHVRVQCEGTALLGSFESPNVRNRREADGPVLRVRGLAVLGSVAVMARPATGRDT